MDTSKKYRSPAVAACGAGNLPYGSVTVIASGCLGPRLGGVYRALIIEEI